MRRIKLGADKRMRLCHEYEYKCASCKRLLPPYLEIDHYVPVCPSRP